MSVAPTSITDHMVAIEAAAGPEGSRVETSPPQPASDRRTRMPFAGAGHAA
jgi:hypothetical protein